jgi:resuscitation-promoting factor RpfA
MALNDETRNAAPGSDERDPGLGRVYGAAPRDEPPARLDAAILAAARREVGARPRPVSALRAWRVPVSIAAVVVLSASLVTLVREEGGDELYQAVRPDVPRAAPPAARAPQPAEGAAKAEAREAPPAGQGAPPSADTPASPPADTRNRDATGTSSRAQERGSSRQSEPAPKADPKPFQDAPEGAGERAASPPPVADDSARAPAAIMKRSPAPEMPPRPPKAAEATAPEARRPPSPSAKAAPAAPSRAMRSERDMPAREDAGGPAMGGAASGPRAMEAPRVTGELSAPRESTPVVQSRVAAMVKELDVQPPERWLERIQALRRDGQSAEAQDLLAEFKRRYPVYPLPPELQ